MNTLFILYDDQCRLCTNCRAWLEGQAAYVRLTFLPFRSPEVARLFPGVDALQPEKEIVVVSDEGEAWQGAHAWVICLWALKEYREWALRLASPALLPLARRLCHFVSANRLRIFPGRSVEDLKRTLTQKPANVCETNGRCRI